MSDPGPTCSQRSGRLLSLSLALNLLLGEAGWGGAEGGGAGLVLTLVSVRGVVFVYIGVLLANVRFAACFYAPKTRTEQMREFLHF